MEDILYLTGLYDYYAGFLTSKQQSYFEDYYFDNLTMEEIAENNNVSKNAISKTLIEVKEKLLEYERILHLYENKVKISEILDENTFNRIKDFV